MPRTIVVVDGDGVQGAAVIEMMLNANLAAQQGTSQSSTGGTKPKHLALDPLDPQNLVSSASHGDAFKKLEEVEATLPSPATLGKRPSLPSLRSSDNLRAVESSSDNDKVSNSDAGSPGSLRASKLPAVKDDSCIGSRQPSPCTTPEEALIEAAADAATASIGPNVLSAKPGYFASSHSQQALPSSLSLLMPGTALATPEPIPPLDLSRSSSTSNVIGLTGEISSLSGKDVDESMSSGAASGTLRLSPPLVSPPKMSRRDADMSVPSIRTGPGSDDISKSSSTSAFSAYSTSKAGAGAELSFSPLMNPSNSLEDPGLSSSNSPGSSRFKTSTPTPVWKLRSLREGPVESTLHTSKSSKWAGTPTVETRMVNYADPASLHAAMAGVYGLYIGLDAFSSSPRLFVEAHVKNIIHAAIRAGCSHVIFAGHVWEPENVSDIVGGAGTGHGADTSASSSSDKQGPAGSDADLSHLPITVQRCTTVYRMLRKLAASGLFRLTVFSLPVCFEAALLCENAWFSLRPKSNTYVLGIPIPSNTVMPFCSLADVGNAALQVFSRPERFDGLCVDLTSDIASARELAVQMSMVIYVSGKKVVHCDDQHSWLLEQLKIASDGEEANRNSLLGPKTVTMLLLREFLLFMAGYTRKPLTLLLPQVRTKARKYNLRLTPWREFAVQFCDDLLVAWR